MECTVKNVLPRVVTMTKEEEKIYRETMNQRDKYVEQIKSVLPNLDECEDKNTQISILCEALNIVIEQLQRCWETSTSSHDDDHWVLEIDYSNRDYIHGEKWRKGWMDNEIVDVDVVQKFVDLAKERMTLGESNIDGDGERE